MAGSRVSQRGVLLGCHPCFDDYEFGYPDSPSCLEQVGRLKCIEERPEVTRYSGTLSEFEFPEMNMGVDDSLDRSAHVVLN